MFEEYRKVVGKLAEDFSVVSVPFRFLGGMHKSCRHFIIVLIEKYL